MESEILNKCYRLSSFIFVFQRGQIIAMDQEFKQLQTTPVKAQRIFFSFSTTSFPHSLSSSPNQTNLLTPISSNSPHKTSSPLQLIKKQSLESSSQRDSSPVGDRYIPNRKLIKKQSLMSEEDFNRENENKGANSLENGLVVSDLYRRFVMSESPKKRKASIQSFQNNNILKFGTNSPIPQESQLIIKEGGLQWAYAADKQQPKARKINKMPVKVLDAPSLQDDYYLNLLDWGSQNLLAVGLSSSVYLWNAVTSKVDRLCDLQSQNVTSVSWGIREPNIAIGGQSGDVQVWDINKMQRVRTFVGHKNRVGALSWSSSLLSSGSRDKSILNRDLRDPKQFISCLQGHKQEVCGLKWSPDEQMLCSGGNDNKLLVWSAKSNEPLLRFSDHQAAVKAVAWSPYQHGMLVSGGGTADRTIRFRNTLTGTTTKVVEAGSQVCCLMFSKVSQELVSTHGYQLNQINLWKLPNMAKVATLTGHSSRVLYLAMSPDGGSIVTGAGDETLRFWNIFVAKKDSSGKSGSLLQTQNLLIR